MDIQDQTLWAELQAADLQGVLHVEIRSKGSVQFRRRRATSETRLENGTSRGKGIQKCRLVLGQKQNHSSCRAQWRYGSIGDTVISFPEKVGRTGPVRKQYYQFEIAWALSVNSSGCIFSCGMMRNHE